MKAMDVVVGERIKGVRKILRKSELWNSLHLFGYVMCDLLNELLLIFKKDWNCPHDYNSAAYCNGYPPYANDTMVKRF
jgi:hypothetical protein